MPAGIRNFGAAGEIIRGDPWAEPVVLEVPADSLGHDPDPTVDSDWQPDPDVDGTTWTMQLRRQAHGPADPEAEVDVSVILAGDVDNPSSYVADLDPGTSILLLELDAATTELLAGGFRYDLANVDTGETRLRGMFLLTDQVTEALGGSV